MNAINWSRKPKFGVYETPCYSCSWYGGMLNEDGTNAINESYLFHLTVEEAMIEAKRQEELWDMNHKEI